MPRKLIATLSDSTVFLREWLVNPQRTGAVAPSSPQLAAAMARWLPRDSDSFVLELGPGTGAVTAALLKRGLREDRLVAIENIHNAKHLAKSRSIRNLNIAVIDTIAEILERGRKSGVFRSRIDPVDLHMLISAFCFFRVSNKSTFGTIFRRDLSSPELRKRHKRMIGDAILSLLRDEAADRAALLQHAPAEA